VALFSKSEAAFFYIDGSFEKRDFFLFSRKKIFVYFCFRAKIFILFLFSRQISNQVFSF